MKTTSATALSRGEGKQEKFEHSKRKQQRDFVQRGGSLALLSRSGNTSGKIAPFLQIHQYPEKADRHRNCMGFELPAALANAPDTLLSGYTIASELRWQPWM